MDNGVVIFVSRNQGMIVVQNHYGFTVIELLGGEGEIERGDVLRGDWMSLGGETIYKAGEPYDAYFQNVYGRADAAVDAARRMGGG